MCNLNIHRVWKYHKKPWIEQEIDKYVCGLVFCERSISITTEVKNYQRKFSAATVLIVDKLQMRFWTAH